MAHILIVDDHHEIRELVSRALIKDGFRVSVAADGRAMRQMLADNRIDLILLDLMLPGEDGLSLCRNVRARSNVPIIMLTAKGDEVDRVIGLEMGADDYLPKPFGSRELVARIKAVLRRSREAATSTGGVEQPKVYGFDRWRLDTSRRELIRDDDVVVPLSTGEYDLLLVFVERPQSSGPRSTARLGSRTVGHGARPEHRHPGEPAAPKARKRRHGSQHHQDRLGRRLHIHARREPRMTRLFPQSLFGQTLLILLVGLVASHGVGSWIYTADRGQAVRAVGGFATAQRIVNLARLIQENSRASCDPVSLPRLATRASGLPSPLRRRQRELLEAIEMSRRR